MSFGLSAADLKEALKICKWIWDNHFDKENTSDERYNQFVRDIKGLERQTTRLKSSIQDAISEVHLYDPEGVELRRELADITGNFLDTLKKCQALLKKSGNVTLQQKRGNIIQNIAWGLNVQDRVDKLCGQLQFHMQRMEFINNEVQDDLLRAILQELARLSEWTISGVPNLETQAVKLVPIWLRAIFARNFVLNRPSSVSDPANMPLGLGCDILHRHYQSRSTPDHARLDPRMQTVYFYLALLKCQWIINTLRQSRHFPRHRPGSPFRRFILNIELEIFQDLQTLMSASSAHVRDQELQELLEHDNEPFLIWTPPKIRHVVSPADREEDEQELPSVFLAGGERLLVFKKETTRFRLVPIVEHHGQMALSPHVKEVLVNTRLDKFIPSYTIPGGPPRHQVLVHIFHENSRRPVALEMRGLQDAWDLQRALTGYEVRAHETDMTWTAQQNFQLLRPRADSRKEKMAGCAQIWAWNPTQEKPQPDPSLHTMTTSSSGSTISAPKSPVDSEKGDHAYSVVSRSPPSRRTSTAMSFASSAVSTTSTFYREYESAQGRQIDLERPTPPVLVFFGYEGDTYTVYHLELSPSIVIEPKGCACSKPDTEPGCAKLIIQSRSAKLTIRKLAAASESDDHPPPSWNLLAFRGDPASGRYAAREYHDKTVVSQSPCDYLSLRFPSPAFRRDFSDRFRITTGVHRDLCRDYEVFKQRRRHEGDRPTESKSSGALGSQYSGSRSVVRGSTFMSDALSVGSGSRTGAASGSASASAGTPRASMYYRDATASEQAALNYRLSLPAIGSKMSIADEFLSPGARGGRR